MPEVAGAALQPVTGTADVVTVLQVVVVKELPALALAGVHESTGVGPVLVRAQVVAT